MTIDDYLSLFASIRDCSHLFALFKTIRDYSSLFLFAAIRYSRLFAIRYSGFPDTHPEWILKNTRLSLKRLTSTCRPMAIANVTGGGKQTESFLRQLCSAGLTDGIHRELIFIAALDIILSVTAFLGNTLILVALRRESSLHPPSKVLLRCLATTDLCVGIIAEPLKACYFMALAQKKWNLCRYALGILSVTGYTLAGVSLLTMTAISVDRLLALLLGLRYRQVVTLTRAYVVVVVVCIVSIFGATLYLKNHLITDWYGCAVTSLCVATSIFSYTKIFLSLRRHQTQLQNHTQQPSQGIPLNLARHRKAVFSTLWVQLTLAICYMHGYLSVALCTCSSKPAVFLQLHHEKTGRFSEQMAPVDKYPRIFVTFRAKTCTKGYPLNCQNER